MKKPKRGLRTLWEKTNPTRLRLSFGIILSLINTACSLIIPLLLKVLIDELINEFSYELLWKLIILFVVELVSMSLSLYILASVGQKIVLNLRERLWDKLPKT